MLHAVAEPSNVVGLLRDSKGREEHIMACAAGSGR